MAIHKLGDVEENEVHQIQITPLMLEALLKEYLTKQGYGGAASAIKNDDPDSTPLLGFLIEMLEMLAVGVAHYQPNDDD